MLTMLSMLLRELRDAHLAKWEWAHLIAANVLSIFHIYLCALVCSEQGQLLEYEEDDEMGIAHSPSGRAGDDDEATSHGVV